jgi:CheY-like chemotaxis protein
MSFEKDKYISEFEDVKDIDNAIVLCENIIKDITELDNIVVFVNRDDILYSPSLDIEFSVLNNINGIVIEAFMTKRVHTIEEATNSFLYNKNIDNILDVKIDNITVIPITNKDGSILAIVEVYFDNDNYLEDIKIFISLIEETLRDIYNKEPKNIEFKPKVLLVDDSYIMLKFLSSILKKYDIDIVTARSAIEAIGKFKYDDISVIFMDDIMIGMSGHEAIEKIREIEIESNRDPIPIFGITSDTTKEAQEKFISSGANLVLYKPIEQTKVIDAMKFFMIF